MKHHKKCSRSLVMREMYLRFHLTAVRRLKIKNTMTPDAGEDVAKEECSSIAGRIASSGNQSDSFSNNRT